ncbi:MAG: cystathionine beta-lyase [Bacteroidetes bacterium GWF2_40_14]|nr:MAG: cystathionine beta-lyase [Bacteroidetes bacterium GWF2_40_14]
MYNFDKIIDRQGTSCVKYDLRKEVFGTEDLLPMWVADMDFQSPPAVTEAARRLSEHGVFGYTFRSESSKEAFISWVAKMHNWDVKIEWITSSPGIVAALPIAIRAFTEKGDKVLIQTPVYPPFHSIVKEQKRELLCSPLYQKDGQYYVDWDDFEAKLKSGVKLFILCNSHNPLGRAWSREELKQMGDLCCKYGVKIFSDEIHSDLALFGNKHTVLASVSEEIAQITITGMAPSKTFNIAGMLNSVIVSSSRELLGAFNKELTSLHLDLGNIFGHITMEAAYKGGEDWLSHLIKYLEGNVNYVYDFLNKELPAVKMVKPQSSFLLWLDFRATGYTHDEVSERLIKVAKLGLNDGAQFGTEGIGFRRMNIGAPLSVVREGMERLKSAF